MIVAKARIFWQCAADRSAPKKTILLNVRQQHRADQVPWDYEKGIETDKPAAQEPLVEVKKQHTDDRDRSQAVNRRLITPR